MCPPPISAAHDDDVLPCRRSRLTPEREAELYDAALQLLAETGYEALTMDAVAARAHASKATIYRLWQGKSRLVAAAIRHMKSKDPHEIDTGSIAGDLHMFAGEIGKVAAENAQLVTAIARAVQLEPELRIVLTECFLEPDTDAVGMMLQRAVERGEIDAANPALTRIAPLVFSVILGRPVIEGAPVDEASLLDLVDSILLPALAVRPAPVPNTETSRKQVS
jgi:AcrR family transcriptional regulator